MPTSKLSHISLSIYKGKPAVRLTFINPDAAARYSCLSDGKWEQAKPTDYYTIREASGLTSAHAYSDAYCITFDTDAHATSWLTEGAAPLWKLSDRDADKDENMSRKSRTVTIAFAIGDDDLGPRSSSCTQRSPSRKRNSKAEQRSHSKERKDKTKKTVRKKK